MSGILPAFSAGAHAQNPAAPAAKNQYIVRFKSQVSDKKASDIVDQRNGHLKKQISHLHAASVVTNDVSKLKNDPNVAYVEPDYLAYATATMNDPGFRNQWDLNNTGQIINTVGVTDADIDAPEAWDKVALSNAGPRIAVLDTGVDQDHQDLAGKLSLQKNFTSSTSYDDFYGHGTHVAGTIAANSNNGIGVAGVCPNCSIMNGKVLGDDGSGTHSAIAAGIVWATDNGAKVISMSLGGTASTQTLLDAVNYAASKGVVVVAAAGNNGANIKSYPAAYTNVIAVAATDNRDARASFSNYGVDWVDVAAPGSYIYATVPNHANKIGALNYAYMSGTSMATPIVSAIAGLVWQQNSSGVDVRNKIESSADKIAGTGIYWSKGRVNAASALTGATTPSPTPTPTPIPSDTTAPSTPYGLYTTAIKFNAVSLKWSPSTDNVKVAGYKIFRNGQVIGNSAGTTYTDSSVTPGTSYSYTVAAYDDAGNQSKASSAWPATTPKAGIFTGRVVNSSGQPIAGAKVQIFTMTNVGITLTTDVNGQYSSPLMQYDVYRVVGSATGYTTKTFYPYLGTASYTQNFSL